MDPQRTPKPDLASPPATPSGTDFQAIRSILDSANAPERPNNSNTGALVTPPGEAPEEVVLPFVAADRRRRFWRFGALGATLVVGLIAAALLSHRQAPTPSNLGNIDNQYGTQQVSPNTLRSTEPSLSTAGTVSVNGQLNVGSTLVLTPTIQPSNAVAGQLYYDETTNQLDYFNGRSFASILSSQDAVVQSIDGLTGALTTGTGLSVANNVMTNAGVLSLQGQTGSVTLTPGGGIAINGTAISNTGVLSVGGQTGNVALGGGLSASGGTLQNTGVLSLGGQNGAIALGGGLSFAGNQLQNSGVLSIIAGSNITVTNDGNGNVTIATTGGSGGSGGVGGNGTGGTLALWAGSGPAGNLTDSILSQSGTTVTVAGTLAATNLSGNGSAVTNVNAAQLGGQAGSYYTNAGNISSGTLNDSRLSANVALYNQAVANFLGSLQQNGSDVCTMAGNCTGVAGGSIGGGGTANKLALFTSSGYTVGNSILSQDAGATTVSIGGNLSVSGTVTATSFTGNGSGVTNVNAAQLGGQAGSYYQNATNLNAGTVNDGRLSSNVALYNNALSNFTGTLQQSGYGVCTLAGNCVGNGAGGAIGGSGTVNQIALFTSSGYTIGNSILSQDAGATTVTVTGDLNVSGNVVATTFSGDGSKVTNVNAAQLEGNSASYYTDAGNLSSGTLADGRLSANVALYNNTTSNFTGQLQQNGADVCTTSGNCAGTGGGVTTSGGTANMFAIFTGAQTIGNSILSQDAGATTLTVAGNLTVTGSVSAASLSGNGSGVTNVNAAQLGGQAGSYYQNAGNLNAGTLNDGRLSTNVALHNAANNFTGALQQNGNDVCTTSGNCVGTSGGAIGGSGTVNKLALFTGSGYTIGDSLLSQDAGATTVSITGSLSVSGNITTTTGTVTAANFSGNGSSVTNVNAAQLEGQGASYYVDASNLSSGTLNDARLSANVAKYGDTTANFLGSLQQGGNAVCTTAGNCVGGGSAGSAVGGSGAANTLAMFTASGTIGNSLLSQDAGATTVTVTGALSVSGNITTTGNVSGSTLYQNGNQVCDTSGNCAGAGGGVTTSSGTANTFAIFTGSKTIGNSLLTQDTGATTVTVTGALSVSGNITTTSGTVTAANFSGNGSGVTNVNAAQLGGQAGSYYTNAGNISSGTLNDGRLSTNVAKYGDTTANFTGTLQHNGNDVCDTTGNCAGAGGGVTDGGTAGTANTFAIFTGAQTIGNSILTQNSGATAISVAGSLTTSGTITAASFSGDGTNITNVNAAKLNGQAGSYYQDATNITAGTLSNTRLTGGGALTVSAGNGLTGGGSVALGGSTALAVQAASGGCISVAAGGISVTPTCVDAATLGGHPASYFQPAGNYLTSESDTLATVTARGATTATASSFTGGLSVASGFSASGTITLSSLNSVGVVHTNASGQLSTSLVSGADIASGTITGTNIAANAVALGTQTTGNYVAGVTAGSGIAVTGTAGAGWSPTVAVDGTVCRTTNNCSASGTAGGDLSGTYPNPKVAGIQGTAVTVTSLATNQLLVYNGTAWVNALLSNSNLASGSYSNITGTGALTAGSIASGFGTISTTSNITTTASVQGGTFDTASVGALNIGTTNATSINLQQNTALAAGKTLTVNGSGFDASGHLGIGTTTPNANIDVEAGLPSNNAVQINSSGTATTAQVYGSNSLAVNRSVTANTTATNGIAFDKSLIANCSSSSISTPFTVANNTMRFLLIQVIGTATVPSYGGVPMTLIAGPISGSASYYLYGLVNPAVGANNVVLSSCANSTIIGVASWYNVNQTTPYTGFTSTSGDGNPSLSLSTTAGQVVVDQFSQYALGGMSAVSPGSGQTQVYSGANYDYIDSSYKLAANGTTTISESGGYNQYQTSAYSALALNPSTTGLGPDITGAVASFSSNCTLIGNSGCYDSSNILDLSQQYTGATGAVLSLQNAGSGDMIDFLNGSGSVVAKIDATGNISTTGTLTVTGSGTSAFTGTVSGANATANNQFVTLSQLNSAVGGVAGGSAIGGSGTANTLALFTAAGTIGNSLLTQDAGATTVTVTGGLSVSGNITTTSGTVTAANLAGNGSGVTNVNAAQLGGQAGSYYTNAGNISSGTLSNSRLNTDVATYDNVTSNFTGALQQGGNNVCTTAGNCVGSGSAGSAIGGSGTANTLALFTAAGTIGNSILTQTGTTSITVGGDTTITGTLTVQGVGTSAFTGTVSGANATANNQFVTLGQANTAYQVAGSYQAAGSYETTTGTDFIRNQAGQQTSAQFNIDGTGTAGTFNATTALQTAGTTRIDGSGNLVNINAITASGNATITGNTSIGGNLTVGTPTYAIGSTGPAGGIVFYDKGDDTGGWRYLEAAPSDVSGTFIWCSNTTTAISGGDTSIGAGKTNTATMVANCTSGAGNAAAAYTGGGYTDWFLPSKNELAQLYTQEAAVGGFTANNYWSSSEASGGTAWVQLFSNGTQGNATKSSPYYVRPVREIAAPPSTISLNGTVTATGNISTTGTLTVTGSGTSAFTGTVSGANATANNQFVTLSQLNSAVGGVAGGSAIGGSGTANTLALFTAAGTIGNSILTQTGTTSITVGGDLSATGTITSSATGKTALTASGAPAASATSSLIQIGSAIQGGSANGTYLGLNAASGYTGDLLNFQVNGTTELQADSAGNLTTTGLLFGVGGVKYGNNIYNGASAVSGTYNTALGLNNTTSNQASTAIGQANNASGSASAAIGSSNTASGGQAIALGNNTTASGDESTALGNYTTAQAYASTVLGQYNVIQGTTTSWVATDQLFAIGNGTSSTARSNALTVLKNGNTTIGGNLNVVSGYQYNGTAGATTTCSSGQFLQNQVVQGGIVTGGTCASAGGGITTVGALDGGTANANGATISGSTIYLQSASTSYAGLVNTTAQTFKGAKTFNDSVTLNNSPVINGGVTISGNSSTSGSFSFGSTIDVTGIATLIGPANLNGLTTLDNVGGPTLVVKTAPIASATSSVIQIGSAIQGGNANGTYLGLNAASGYSGDLLNFQLNGTKEFSVSGTGNMYLNGYLQPVQGVNSTAGAGIFGGGLQTGGGLTVTGGSVSITNTSGSNTSFLGSGVTVKTSGGNISTAFQVQNASTKTIFNVDTSASIITLGDSTSGNYITVSSTGLTAYGTARHTRTLSFSPEYAGAVLDGTNCSGTANGTMTSGFDGTNSYYQWANTQATSQCYDIVVETTLPKDFDSWAASDTMNTWSSSFGTGQVTFTLKNAGGTADPSLNGVDVSPTSSSTWNTASLATPTGTYSAGQKIHLIIHMNAPQNVNVRVSDIQLNYYSKF